VIYAQEDLDSHRKELSKLRIDLPSCDFRMCRRYFDGNCNASENGRESCEYKYLQQQQLTNGWIPVSEKPKDNELVYLETIVEGNKEHILGSWDCSKKTWKIGNDAISWDWIENSPVEEVIAWKPIQESFIQPSIAAE
jgi:hypothetical protein